MNDMALGQVWEVYSDRENRWVRAVISKQEDDEITFRYEGTLEIFTVNRQNLSNSEHFRVIVD